MAQMDLSRVAWWSGAKWDTDVLSVRIKLVRARIAGVAFPRERLGIASPFNRRCRPFSVQVLMGTGRLVYPDAYLFIGVRSSLPF